MFERKSVKFITASILCSAAMVLSMAMKEKDMVSICVPGSVTTLRGSNDVGVMRVGVEGDLIQYCSAFVHSNLEVWPDDDKRRTDSTFLKLSCGKRGGKKIFIHEKEKVDEILAFARECTLTGSIPGAAYFLQRFRFADTEMDLTRRQRVLALIAQNIGKLMQEGLLLQKEEETTDTSQLSL